MQAGQVFNLSRVLKARHRQGGRFQAIAAPDTLFSRQVQIAMPDHSVHKAGDLAGDERSIVERWLGRTLSDDETISVNAYRPHPAPDVDNRQVLRRSILAQAREIGSRAGALSDEEIDDLLDEALSDARGHRQ